MVFTTWVRRTAVFIIEYSIENIFFEMVGNILLEVEDVLKMKNKGVRNLVILPLYLKIENLIRVTMFILFQKEKMKKCPRWKKLDN